MRLAVACLVTAFGCHAGVTPSHEHGHHTGGPAPLLDGLGDYHRPIATKNPDAQRYFDQGLRLLFAFNYDEAERSFGEALRLDPTCASCAWGYALALGPYANNGVRQEPGAVAAADHAIQVAAEHGTPLERALAKAQRARVAEPAPDDRSPLDEAYAKAMREVGHAYPDDVDVQDFVAEALLMSLPQFQGPWKPDGTPTSPLVDEVRGIEEHALAAAPSHPGLNHLYIHTLEGSALERAKATHAAELLMTAMPGAGHMLHMPSHIFMRIGRLAEAEEANRRGIAADRTYLAAHDPGGMYPMMIHHNEDVLWAILLMRGESKDALAIVAPIEQALPQMLHHAPAQFHAVVRNMFMLHRPQTLVRFARWNDILALKAPEPDLPLAQAIHHWARGLALVAGGKLQEGDAELAAIDKLAATFPTEMPWPLLRPIMDVGREQLAGALASARHHSDEAVAHFEKAVAAEDQLDPSAEPPMWNMPSRHLLGAELLVAGRAKDAEAVYREDLHRVPENGWALAGLAAALRAEKSPDAAGVEQRFHAAWQAADVKTTGSVL